MNSSARSNMNNSSVNGFIRMKGMNNLLKTNYSKTYLSDLKKTFIINIDMLKRYIVSNTNPINTKTQL